MKSYVIEYDRRSGSVEVEEFVDRMEATRARLMKTRTRASRDIEVVSVNSRSEESLRRSHSRYFMRETALH